MSLRTVRAPPQLAHLHSPRLHTLLLLLRQLPGPGVGLPAGLVPGEEQRKRQEGRAL